MTMFSISQVLKEFDMQSGGGEEGDCYHDDPSSFSGEVLCVSCSTSIYIVAVFLWFPEVVT